MSWLYVCAWHVAGYICTLHGERTRYYIYEQKIRRVHKEGAIIPFACAKSLVTPQLLAPKPSFSEAKTLCAHLRQYCSETEKLIVHSQ
jgi:hypothetical protein